MVKEDVFYLPKIRKALEKSRTFVLGCKIVVPLCVHSTKMQLALFYIIPFFINFKISYRFVRNEKEPFLKLIFYI